MEKTADRKGRRGLFQRLDEWSNISGRAAERFFSPELKRVMDNIRANDDQIRANVVGEKIGEAMPVSNAKALKDVVKLAKTSLNRREYMSAVSHLSQFHRQMEAVNESITKINQSVDKIHDEFLFNGLQDDQKQHLLEMKNRFAPKAASFHSDLVKEASIADFLANYGTRRGRALAMWEKHYPKAAEQLKKDTRALVEESESLIATTLSSLKAMGTARANRAVDDYVRATDVIRKKYEVYDKLFRAVYARSYERFIKQIESQQIAPAAPVTESKDLGEKTVTIPTTFGPGIKTDVPEGAAPAVPDLNLPGKSVPALPAAPQVAKSPADEALDKLEQMQKATPAPQQLPLQFTPAQPNPIKAPIAPTPLKVAPEPLQATTHRKFYETLEAMSNESPLVLASFIKKYATSIKSSDPETAVQLLSIVKRIKG